MEILRFLLSLISGENSDENYSQAFAPFYDLMNGNTDLKTFLNDVTPLLKSAFIKTQKNPSEDDSEGLNPIAGVADRDIVYALNLYFAQPD